MADPAIASDHRRNDGMIDIVAIGEALVEFNQTGEGSGRTYLQGFGGDTSNALIAAVRQGATGSYFTRLGDDEFGRMCLQLWRDEGVDAREVLIDATAATGIYFVRHGKEGHTFSYLRAGSAASLVQPSDVPAQLIERARFLHVSGISQAISASATDTVFHAIRVAKAGRSEGRLRSESAAQALAAGPRPRGHIGHDSAGGLLSPEPRRRAAGFRTGRSDVDSRLVPSARRPEGRAEAGARRLGRVRWRSSNADCRVSGRRRRRHWRRRLLRRLVSGTPRGGRRCRLRCAMGQCSGGADDNRLRRRRTVADCRRRGALHGNALQVTSAASPADTRQFDRSE